jgi:signal peptidase II
VTIGVAAAVAVGIVLADLITKELVTRHLVEGRLYAVGRGVGLRRSHNDRGALVALSPPQAALTWAAMAAGVVWLLMLAAPRPGPMVAAGLGMVVGGAAGNVVGRFIHGTVVDFVAAGRWPVFNLADGSMAAGVLVALWAVR